jgi:NADH-quinone oxidoreductase subunit L
MDEETEKHVHESPWSMLVPLIVLAVASLLGGFLGLPGKLGLIQHFLEPVFAPANEILGIHEHSLTAVDYVLMVVSVIVAMLGIVLAWFVYIRRAATLPALLGARLRPAYKVVYNKFYVDEFYDATFVRLAVDGSRWVWHHFDERIIDGGVHGLAWLWQRIGTGLRPIETGRVQNYLLAMFIGVFVIVTLVVFL